MTDLFHWREEVTVLQVALKTKPCVKFRSKLNFLNPSVVLLIGSPTVMILMKVLKTLSCQGIVHWLSDIWKTFIFTKESDLLSICI